MHSETLRRLRGVELYYASRIRERADAVCRRYAGAGTFGDYLRGMKSHVDVVVVATPTVSHRELTECALRSGKHVIVEKPAFMRASDADEVRAVAATSDRRVFVAENYFYKPVARHLRRTIAAGDLGIVRFVTINATKRQRSDGWRANPSLAGGGALFEGGVHWVSFASNIGLEVASVRGFPTGSPASALVVLQYSTGAVGTLAYSWELAAPFGGLRLSKVQGTGGAVTFESNGLLMVSSGRGRSVHFPLLHDPLGRSAMWVDFLRALKTGAEPQFTLAMAQRDLELLEAAGASPPGGHPRLTSPRSVGNVAAGVERE